MVKDIECQHWRLQCKILVSAFITTIWLNSSDSTIFFLKGFKEPLLHSALHFDSFGCPIPFTLYRFPFFVVPSLSIFSSPAGQGSPAAARAPCSLPTFSSTCSYLARQTRILRAWRQAICSPTLHHFTLSPWSLCVHPNFLQL